MVINSLVFTGIFLGVLNTVLDTVTAYKVVQIAHVNLTLYRVAQKECNDFDP